MDLDSPLHGDVSYFLLCCVAACAGIGGLMEMVQGNYEYCHYMQVCVCGGGGGLEVVIMLAAGG